MGIKGLCTLCGEGNLFIGFLDTNSSCQICKCDFTKAIAGDSPAGF